MERLGLVCFALGWPSGIEMRIDGLGFELFSRLGPELDFKSSMHDF